MDDSTIEVELTVRDGQNKDEQTVILQRELIIGDSINEHLGELIADAAERIDARRRQKYHVGLDGEISENELRRVRQRFADVDE